LGFAVKRVLVDCQNLFWDYWSVVCTNVDQKLIADQRNFKAQYLQNGEEN